MRVEANRLSSAVGLIATCLLAWTGAAVAEPPALRLASRWDLKELGRDFPHALDTFQRADAAAAAGRRQEAVTLFKEAGKLAPKSPAPPRRLCEVLTELGRRDEALEACRVALEWGDAPEDFRAMVGAQMSGRQPPHVEELVMALVMALGLENRVSNDPSGYAALFDIALRLGDRELMKAKLRDLERISPDHYDTGRARRLVATSGPGLGTLAGWGVLAILVALTAARSIGRVRMRARARTLSRAALTALATVTLVGSPARAELPPDPTQGLSKFKVDDANPTGSLPAREEFQKSPVDFGYLVMDLAEKADQATRRKDYPQAIKYYEALVKIAPDRSIGHGKICEVHELAGDRERALASCRTALRIDGVRTEDYDRFLRLLLASPPPLTQAQRDEVSTIVAHLKSKPENLAAASEIECRVAVHTEDASLLERCTATLAGIAPTDPKTINFEWALATLNKDLPGAKRALEKARQAGVKGPDLSRMASVTREAEMTRAISYVVALVLVLAAASVLFFRRRELQAVFARKSAT